MLVSDTKERILNAAERLFAEEGFAGTSLRAVTAAAGVNLAAVNYHFHSKEVLFQEVVQRRLGALATERLRRLDALQKSGQELSLETLLDAYLMPVFELFAEQGEQGPILRRFLMRVIAEPNPRIQQIVITSAQEMAAAYMSAFAQVLPDLSPAELWWRFRALNIIVLLNHTSAIDTSLLMGQWLPHAPTPELVDPAWMMTFLLSALRGPATLSDK